MIKYGDWKWTCDGCGHSETHPSHRGITGWFEIQVVPSFMLGGRNKYNLCPKCAIKAKEVSEKVREGSIMAPMSPTKTMSAPPCPWCWKQRATQQKDGWWQCPCGKSFGTGDCEIVLKVVSWPTPDEPGWWEAQVYGPEAGPGEGNENSFWSAAPDRATAIGEAVLKAMEKMQGLPPLRAPRDLDRGEYLDLLAKGQVTDEERLIYLEGCYMTDDLSRDSRSSLSAEIDGLRKKIHQNNPKWLSS